jgi:hypothetical protein
MNFRFLRLSFVFFVLFSLKVNAQVSKIDSIKRVYKMPYYINEAGDTILYQILAPVVIIDKRVFKNKREEIKYNKLVYNVKKVYPYALEARKRLDELNKKLVTLPNDDKLRKKYVKNFEEKLVDDYSEELKKLTTSQGRLLIKLVDRETNRTTYDLIKEYRGSTSAFFWQSFATIFGTNLRVDYDPLEDRDIEGIIYWIEHPDKFTLVR